MPKSSCPRWLWSASKNGNSTTSPGNLWQCSVTLAMDKYFLMFRGTCVSVCAFCLWTCHWAPLRSPGSIFSAHLLQVFIYIGETTLGPSLLQAEQPQLSQLLLISHMFQSLNHLRGPSLDSLQYVHISLVLGSPRTGGDGKKHLPLDLLI